MQFWTSFNWINSYFYFLKLLGPYSRNWPTTLTGHQYWGDLAVKGGICPAPWNMCHSLQIDYQVALECWPCSTLVQIQYCLGVWYWINFTFPKDILTRISKLCFCSIPMGWRPLYWLHGTYHRSQVSLKAPNFGRYLNIDSCLFLHCDNSILPFLLFRNLKQGLLTSTPNEKEAENIWSITWIYQDMPSFHKQIHSSFNSENILPEIWWICWTAFEWNAWEGGSCLHFKNRWTFS